MCVRPAFPNTPATPIMENAVTKPRRRAVALTRAELADLDELPNVGPAVARYLRRVGIRRPQDLLGRDPYQLFDQLCRVTGKRHDPCLLDTFIAAVRFMGGEPAEPWWAYTAERKRRSQRAPANLSGRGLRADSGARGST